MSTAAPLRPRNNTAAQRSGFADGQPLWHLALDAGALTVLLGLGVLGFSLSFGGDPYYLHRRLRRHPAGPRPWPPPLCISAWGS